MYAQQRHAKILDTVNRAGRVAVADLATEFTVVPETIRRDLDQMAERDLLVRVHGGAIARRTAVLEPDLPTRAATNTDAKRRIAGAAARLLPRDASAGILIDAGTTTAELIPHLDGRTGTVLTNSPAIAQAALAHHDLEVRILPGRLRGTTQAAVGADTVQAVRRLRPAVVFLGCNGLTADGFTTPDPEEAAVKHAMVEQAGLRVVLADSTKVGAQHLVTFAVLREIDALVTDAPLPAPLQQSMTDAGIEVLTA
ncbi:MAG: DeoR/GlpR family DNA-binding transcription regulator [Brachybacterium sp.]|nr:DeoR/GlpR family DNA-binding transcription regulator [Brachybacterium sp.]